MPRSLQIAIGQISQVQRDRLVDITRWLGEVGAGPGSSRYGRIQMLLADISANIGCVKGIELSFKYAGNTSSRNCPGADSL